MDSVRDYEDVLTVYSIAVSMMKTVDLIVSRIHTNRRYMILDDVVDMNSKISKVAKEAERRGQRKSFDDVDVRKTVETASALSQWLASRHHQVIGKERGGNWGGESFKRESLGGLLARDKEETDHDYILERLEQNTPNYKQNTPNYNQLGPDGKEKRRDSEKREKNNNNITLQPIEMSGLGAQIGDASTVTKKKSYLLGRKREEYKVQVGMVGYDGGSTGRDTPYIGVGEYNNPRLAEEIWSEKIITSLEKR